MTRINGNKILSMKETLTKDGEQKLLFTIQEITDNGTNTYYLTTKEKELELLLKNNVGKNITCNCIKNGNFLSINKESNLKIITRNEDLDNEEVEEILEEVKVIRIIEKNNLKTMIVKTKNDFSLDIKIKDSENIRKETFGPIINKIINIKFINIFRSKEGKVFYSISKDLKKHIQQK